MPPCSYATEYNKCPNVRKGVSSGKCFKKFWHESDLTSKVYHNLELVSVVQWIVTSHVRQYFHICCQVFVKI